jgi:hypothetical protein
MISNIRTSLGNHDLRRKTRQLKRNKAIYNFNTARTAGILFTSESEEDFNAVKDFKQYLEDHKITVEVLGYVHDKQVPDHYLLRTGFSFFCMKDLNWYQRPARQFAIDFYGRDFDILFDLSIEEYFPLKYISGVSPAAYKIGVYKETSDYDLMIGLKDRKDLPYFVEQIKHYLSLIHSKNSGYGNIS